MEVVGTADIGQFREEIRTWLHENDPGEPPPLDTVEMREWSAAWQRKLYDEGWAGIDWPTEYGGRGLSFLEQIIWFEEYVQAGLPVGHSCFVVALAHAGPTLIARGSDEQKAQYLPPILKGEAVWCQGFSEPGSGSDLASLSTKAEIDGDVLVVNGQKVWTSYAHLADFQELLVRSDPSAPKHKGITWVVCDMHSPGIEVRPIRTIDGGAHFSEIFYEDVRIPLENVVGNINEGWSVAMATLAIERGPAALDYQLGTLRDIDGLIDVAKTKDLLRNDELANRLAAVRAEGAALRSMTYLSVSESKSGDAPSPMTTAVRTFWGELQHKVGRLAIDVLGSASLELGTWSEYWLTQFSAGIAGGTKDIQKNIIGERVLGLPAMIFVLTPEQREVGAVAQKFLAQELPLPHIRELAEAAESGSAPLAIDDATWSRCADMGWFALGIPESLGGVGCGPTEEIMLFTELGRQLAPGPFVSTVMAAWVSAATGAQELAGDLFEGRARAGLQVGEFVLDAEPGGLVVRLDGVHADICRVESLNAVASVDPSVRLARAELGAVVAELDDPLMPARAQLLVSAMELGIADAVLTMSVDYAKTRTQFGTPIGTFQAVKHRCADMAMRVHASRAQTMFASFHVDGRAPDAAFQSAAAKVVSTKAAKLNTGDNVQNHGAIGFTVEHDAGLFARRAHMYEFMLGGDASAGVSMLQAERHRFETLSAPVEQWFEGSS